LLPIQKSTVKVVLLSIQKSTTKTKLEISSENYVAADSEVGSQELCCCQFKNWQPRTMTLPIQRSAVKNSVAADSNIDNQ
jgi:hypothetical protein